MDFKEELLNLKIDANQKMLEQFSSYYHNLIQTNEKMNLTAITEEEEVYCKHFIDSLEISRVIGIDDKLTLCDVGSGAGFPSIPYAIVNGNADITIIDALNKRINFLNSLVKELKLDNVLAIHARAEDFAKVKREYFDVVTARAVARLNILVELCLPLTKVGGMMIAMKGSSGKEELDEALKAINVLGGTVKEVLSVDLPNDMGKRELIVIKKIKSTPTKYPRQFAKIKERPII